MNDTARIRRAQTRVANAREAVRALHAGVVQDDMTLVVFFCASSYDLDAIADEMRRCFAGVQVVGCTSTGEIGPEGYLEHSLTGASFGARDFTAVSGCLTGCTISTTAPVRRSPAICRAGSMEPPAARERQTDLRCS